MDYFRKFLTFLRKGTNTQGRAYFYRWGAVALVAITGSILVDLFVPFGAWWNLIRTVILVPLSVSLFAVGYGISLILHRMRSTDPNWQPYRTRFSPLWRMRISAIVGALALVMVYAAGESPVFTLLSSFLLAVGLALVAFMRRTSQELKREKLGIPDSRDVSYDSEVRKLQESRKRVVAERVAKREAKREGRTQFRAFRPLGSEKPEDRS